MNLKKIFSPFAGSRVYGIKIAPTASPLHIPIEMPSPCDLTLELVREAAQEKNLTVRVWMPDAEPYDADYRDKKRVNIFLEHDKRGRLYIAPRFILG